MSVLLDEDIPIRFRRHFPEGIEAWVEGFKNGALLSVAQEQFDVRVTMDDKLPSQQNLRDYDLAVIVLRARSKRMSDLLPLMPQIGEQLRDLHRGAATRVDPDSSSSDAQTT